MASVFNRRLNQQARFLRALWDNHARKRPLRFALGTEEFAPCALALSAVVLCAACATGSGSDVFYEDSAGGNTSGGSGGQGTNSDGGNGNVDPGPNVGPGPTTTTGPGPTTANGPTTTNGGAFCGDGACGAGEDSCTCAGDCLDDANSCSVCECGAGGPTCFCDDACVTNGDCCANAVAFCGLTGGGDSTCEAAECGDVGGTGPFGDPCWCDSSCVIVGDCCTSACSVCGAC